MRYLTPRALAATAALVLAGHASAQTVYRSVDANGRVTFSDLPAGAASTNTALEPAQTTQSVTAALPYNLRQVASQYPVTLYTAPNCAPCDSGRRLLQSRGIPYAEKTVTTPQDMQTLQRLSGKSALPLLTLGVQQINGFADAEWTLYLTAAGYPEKSLLPENYRNPNPLPLVALETPAPAVAEAAAAAKPAKPAPTPAPASANPANPAGIRF